jgi:hypothetical protein
VVAAVQQPAATASLRRFLILPPGGWRRCISAGSVAQRAQWPMRATRTCTHRRAAPPPPPPPPQRHFLRRAASVTHGQRSRIIHSLLAWLAADRGCWQQAGLVLRMPARVALRLPGHRVHSCRHAGMQECRQSYEDWLSVSGSSRTVYCDFA